MKKLTTTEILNHVTHRIWKNPKRKWNFYQEWNNAIFLHWEIEKELLQDLIPDCLEIDTFKDKAWISLVAFSMENIRPRYIPAFPPISNFIEINLRTYVTKDNKPGVYFLNIEAEKWFSAYLSKKISGLPYEKSEITHDLNERKLRANFKQRNFNLEIDYQIGSTVLEKTELDIFLTERYCLYLDVNDKIYRNEIQHLPWEINELTYSNLTTNYSLNKIELNRKPDLVRHSKGIQVLAWNKDKVIL